MHKITLAKINWVMITALFVWLVHGLLVWKDYRTVQQTPVVISGFVDVKAPAITPVTSKGIRKFETVTPNGNREYSYRQIDSDSTPVPLGDSQVLLLLLASLLWSAIMLILNCLHVERSGVIACASVVSLIYLLWGLGFILIDFVASVT